jgi:epoxyqueuosine reductase
MNKTQLSLKIKAEAKNLGFFACGIAKADAVDQNVVASYKKWIGEGGHATMAYLENYPDKRFDPRLLMDSLKSIVSVALNYAPANTLPEGEPQFAAYSLGKDYHDVVKNKLRQLAETLGFDEYRAFCDSAPVLERYWAVKAGLGWTGRNHQLIIPHAGSMFFLGELFLPVDLEYDEPMPSRCGKCHACVDACSTHALSFVDGSSGTTKFDARSCLSYQTIENRGDIPTDLSEKMGDTIYGCDRCQTACPWNRFSQPNDTPELQPTDELLHMKREDWLSLTEDDYRRLFKGSAVKRAKYSGLMRNIHEALE